MHLSEEKKNALKQKVFEDGRLLEQKIYSFVFENTLASSVLSSIIAYQNVDGGFGYGIEPDLMVPASTGIGMETALTLLDLVECDDRAILSDAKKWVESSVNERGIIEHPPKDLIKYPHGSWWEGSDDVRILAIVALLLKHGVKLDKDILEKVDTYAMAYDLPEIFEIYDYPIVVYSTFHRGYERRDEVINHFSRQINDFSEKNKKHYPFLSRYWYYFTDMLQKEQLEDMVETFINELQEDGCMKNPYPDLPKWGLIFTLDAYLVLKKCGYGEGYGG